MKIQVSLRTEAGVLDYRIVATEDAAKQAVIELIEGIPYLQDGDRITISRINQKDQAS